MAGPERKRSSEIINLSSLDATYEAPPFLLFQVKVPFIVPVSTNPMFIMNFWKAMESLPSCLIPPFFSVRDLILLKSHATIQGILGCLAISSSREVRSLSLSSCF